MNLPTIQKAQVSEVLAYMHEQIRKIILESCEEVEERGGRPTTNEKPPVRMSWEAWQRLLSLEMQLAVYLRTIAEPH